VIDERFDTELIREMAAAHPEWQIVLVGPVVKIDPAHLPQAANIHYMGQRTYDELPKFLAGWDVCLLPFALNESTKFISPTKVLEYMAAELPSVSTPITDVKVPTATWSPSPRPRPSSSPPASAYHLGPDTVLLEKNATVGGWCRSIQDHGFTFDYAGHIMFSNDPYVLKLYDILLGDNQHWQMREAWVYSKQVYTRYPFQGALYGLPPAVIKECILGAIESRYGLAGGAPRCDSEAVNDCCADGTADVANSTSSVSSNNSGKAENRSGGQAAPAQTENFEDFIYRVWGAGIARHFAIPYNKKIWTVPLKEMETSWLGGRVPLPDLSRSSKARWNRSPSRWDRTPASAIRARAASRRWCRASCRTSAARWN
jgi:hypothetical protein